MRYVQFGKTDLKPSVLGFGCAGVMGRAGLKQSLRALHSALDAGITIFDTARSYGYGESEAVLGKCLKGRRDKVIISTKFGIAAVRQDRWKHIFKPLAREVFKLVPPQGRSVLRRQAAGQVDRDLFSVSWLRTSLDQSLRALGTDYVDLLFLHSPHPVVLYDDELFRALDAVVGEGRVRYVGVSGGPELVRCVLERNSPLISALQVSCNWHLGASNEAAEISPGSSLGLVANQPFGGRDRIAVFRRTLGQLARDQETPECLREKLGAVTDSILADLALNAPLKIGGANVVLPSMLQERHVLQNVNAITESILDHDELLWIRRYFTSTQ